MTQSQVQTYTSSFPILNSGGSKRKSFLVIFESWTWIGLDYNTAIRTDITESAKDTVRSLTACPRGIPAPRSGLAGAYTC